MSDCNHDWELEDMRMSLMDPPKAWYEFRCFECGKIVEGHSEDLQETIPSVKKSTPEDEEIPTVEDIKEQYLRGNISKEIMEEEMNKLFGLE